MHLILTLLPLALSPLSSSHDLAPGDHWPHWRGPDGTGVARGEAPTSWGAEENIAWTFEDPGRGFSTPVVWGDRLFLTTAVSTGKEPERTGNKSAEFHGGGGQYEEQEFIVTCLDRNSGEMLWSKVANSAFPHEGFHKSYGSFASYSPLTDGERLYVSFGSWGFYCYDLDGELLWEHDFGVEMIMRRQFGEGTAPALHGDVILQVLDQEGPSTAVALDKKTGKELWSVERDEPSTWATPLVIEHEGVAQFVTSGTNSVRSYAPKTGKILWQCGGLGLNAIPMPQHHEGAVLAMTGYKQSRLMAIELGGEGDVTESRVSWSTTKGLSYTASPVLVGGRLYCAMDRGFMSCFDAKSGEAHYVQERLPRGSTLKASPIAVGDHLYVATEGGDVHLIKLGDTLDVVATNTLPDHKFIASPIAVGGDLYLRSESALLCIRED